LSWEKIKVFLKTSTLLIYIIGLQIFILILTIWTRASGPRTRIDQLNSYTWKKAFIHLLIIIVFIIILFYFL
jgi:NADH:ubiquinone oxidoreductase subunit H